MISSYAFLVSVCDTATKSSSDPIVGTWTLTSLTQGSTTMTGATLAAYMTMVMTVAADNTYSATATFMTVPIGTKTGTWSVSSGTYTITPSSGNPGTGTISGNTFVMTDPTSGQINTFTKS